MLNNKSVYILLFILIYASCGMDIPDDLNFSLYGKQPKVLKISPSPGVTNKIDKFEITFSDRINKMSVSKKSVCLLKDFPSDKNISILLNDITRDENICTDVDYEMSEDEERISITSTDESFSFQTALIITNRLLSAKNIPFNQTPEKQYTPYLAVYHINLEHDETSPSGSSGWSSGSTDGSSGSSSGSSPINRPSFLIINEALYDVAGADTNGEVFIELCGEAGANISGYKIIMVNGDNGKIYDTIKIPDKSYIPDDGLFVIADKMTGSEFTTIENADFLVNFDPQNGPDCFQLVTEKDLLIDSVGYGEVPVLLAENNLECYENIPSVDPINGKSISRIDCADTNDNSLDFIESEPTPGIL